jgi:hypothetical protein
MTARRGPSLKRLSPRVKRNEGGVKALNPRRVKAAKGRRRPLSGVPLARLRALRCCAETHLANVSDVWKAIGRGNRYGAKWELDALEAIGLVTVIGPSEDDDPKAERRYVLTEGWRGVYESVASLYYRSLF